MTRILVIDTYDSFVFTSSATSSSSALKPPSSVTTNKLDEVIKLAEEHDGVLVSPGPGAPAEAGVIIDTIRWAARRRSRYWVSASATRLIAEVSAAPSPTPPRADAARPPASCTRTSPCSRTCPCPFTATRYHPGGRTRNHARRPGNHLHHRQRHHHGPAPPRSPPCRRAVHPPNRS